MSRPRVVEPEGVIGTFTVESYDCLMRGLMKKGSLDTAKILAAGIPSGGAREIGPGPGHLGLDWLARTQDPLPTGWDIRADMISVARRNASDFHLNHRARYLLGDSKRRLFRDGPFDAVFSNGPLHEWSDPQGVLREIYRVLRPGGVYYLSHLDRDVTPPERLLLQVAIPSESRQGFLSSLQAAYALEEFASIREQSPMKGAVLPKEEGSLAVSGKKDQASGRKARSAASCPKPCLPLRRVRIKSQPAAFSPAPESRGEREPAGPAARWPRRR